MRMLFVYAAALALFNSSALAATAASYSPIQCFNDVVSAKWGPNEANARANAMLMCAQTASAVLAVLDAVDRAAVAPSAAGSAARQLAFDVMANSRKEIEGRAFAAGAPQPTPEQLRTYVSDDIRVLRENRLQLRILVDGAWEDPALARTQYAVVTKRVLSDWAKNNPGLQ